MKGSGQCGIWLEIEDRELHSFHLLPRAKLEQDESLVLLEWG